MMGTSDRVPLVLIPGLLCNERLWEPQQAALHDRAHIWIPDISGLRSLSEAVDRILAEAPFERFSLAGLSMGGYMAALATLRAPVRVQRLALLNTRAQAVETEAGRRRRAAQIELARRDFPAVIEQLLCALLRPAAMADASLVSAVRDMSLAMGADVFIRQQAANMTRPAIAGMLGRIACPTWIIAGDQDAIAPLDSQHALAAAIPSARLRVLPDCGHLSTLEHPAAVNQLLSQWLSG
ncbi:MAG: alpha/beta hydrolase [Pigmentiphaga sp.]|uniref:alpha/beta fold hydrolase n=1 Tax=Pigmentiphaga sp. TaxID=1977564 RepID=UPI0029B59540|nr:alpha/beta hydrolase [Pigmentiphaga sp.]MDX3905340.1 alpha/beta hydrolase [Pigmentiphaga sp.]